MSKSQAIVKYTGTCVRIKKVLSTWTDSYVLDITEKNFLSNGLRVWGGCG